MLSTTPRKLKLRVITAVAVASVAALGLVGCSSGSSQTTGSATKGTVTWWGWTPQPNSAKTYIAAFNKVYPDIKVTYKELQISGWEAALRPALASSTGPDVYNIEPGAYLSEFGGSALDLTPAVKKALGSDWKTKLAPIGVSGLSTKAGKLAALSVGSTFAGPLWINEDLFKKYNVTPPKTLSEWVSDCAVFKSHGVGCFVQGASSSEGFNTDTLQAIADSVKPGVWAAASEGTAKWSDPAIVKALGIWKQLFSDGIMEPGALGVQQYPDADNDFLSGKYAMVMMGTWYMQYSTVAGMTDAISAAGVADPKPFPILPVAFPDVAGSGHSNALFGDSDYGLAVNSKSKNAAAATTFAVWLGTSTAGQQEIANALNDIPALNGVKPQWNSIKLVSQSAQQSALQNLTKQTSTVKESRLALISANLGTAILVATNTVAAGDATPAAAAATLQASAVASGEKFKG